MPRDTAGNYTLPAGNPVASGEIISASWANSTMNDLGQSLSASLDRYGRGGMLAPFQFTDGTESAPGATWSNEPTTGLYRAAYGDLRFTLTGTDVQRWTSANSYLWRNSQWEEILTQTGGGGDTTINNLVVTGSFTSPGIDDNATSTAITIDANENVGIGVSPASGLGTTLSVGSTGTTAGIHFSANDTTGASGIRSSSIYQNETDLVFSTAGVGATSYGSEAMRITSTGNVGIGTTSAGSSSVLAVAQSSTTTGLEIIPDDGNDRVTMLSYDRGSSAYKGYNIHASEWTFRNNGVGEAMRIDGDGNLKVANGGRIYVMSSTGFSPFIGESANGLDFWTNTAKRMTIDSSGNVGIGDPDPSNPLSILNGSSNPVKITRSSNSVGIAMTTSASGGWGLYDYAASNYDLFMKNGSVGIGTASPNQLLTLGSSTSGATIGMDFETANSSRGSILYRASQGSMDFTSGYAGYGGVFTFTNNGSESMRIDSDGRVGIGTDAPDRLLDVATEDSIIAAFRSTGGTSNNRRLEIGTGGGKADLRSFIDSTDAPSDMSFSTGSNERMRIDTSGNLLVGATSQSSVENGSAIGISLSNAAVYRSSKTATSVQTHAQWINPNGVVGTIGTNGIATTYNTSSDVRLKENIVDAPAGNIDSIKVRSFDWKADGSHQEYGFIAQELETVAPYAVSKGETDEDTWGVDYSKLVPMLVKEIQDLKAEVAALKA